MSVSFLAMPMTGRLSEYGHDRLFKLRLQQAVGSSGPERKPAGDDHEDKEVRSGKRKAEFSSGDPSNKRARTEAAITPPVYLSSAAPDASRALPKPKRICENFSRLLCLDLALL